MNSDRRTPSELKRLLLTSALLLLVIACAGCGRAYPRMDSMEGVQYLNALRTACSSQNPDRLEKVSEAIEGAYVEEELSEPQYQALREIIETAHAGDWEKAERMCHSYQKSQIR